MKPLVNIEQLDLDQLESAAAQEDVKVPEDLTERIESALAAAILAGEGVDSEADERPAGRNPGGSALEGEHPDVGPKGQTAGSVPATKAVRHGGRTLRWLPLAGIAAAAAIALLLALPRTGAAPLQDTYDDPEQAYAQVEATFKLISSKMTDGVALAAESGRQAGKPAQIIDKINRK